MAVKNRTHYNWAATRCVTDALADAGYPEGGYAELVDKLNALGYETLTLESFLKRLQRGAFGLDFALRLLRVAGVDRLLIGQIAVRTYADESQRSARLKATAEALKASKTSGRATVGSIRGRGKA